MHVPCSGLHLLRMRYVLRRYYMWCSFSIRIEMDGLDNLRLVRDCIMGVLMALLTHVVSIIYGWTCHPRVGNLSNTWVQFCSFYIMESHGSLS